MDSLYKIAMADSLSLHNIVCYSRAEASKSMNITDKIDFIALGDSVYTVCAR
jgi:hypothetical protein